MSSILLSSIIRYFEPIVIISINCHLNVALSVRLNGTAPGTEKVAHYESKETRSSLKGGTGCIPLSCATSQDKDMGVIRKEEEEDLRSDTLSQLDDDCAENLGSIPVVVTGRAMKTAPEVIKKKAKRQKRF